MQGKSPKYASVSFSEGGLKGKLNKMFFNTFQALHDRYGEESGFKAELKELSKCINKNKSPVWTKPEGFHLIQHSFEEDKQPEQMLKDMDFKEGEQVKVDVKAVIFIPNKLIVGLCFPDTKV